MIISDFDRVENIVEKGKNTGCHIFFPQYKFMVVKTQTFQLI